MSVSLETSCAPDKLLCCFYSSSIRYNSKLGMTINKTSVNSLDDKHIINANIS